MIVLTIRTDSGGSETFTDKQGFFYHEIRKFHQKKPHDKLLLRIERDRILQSVKEFELVLFRFFP